jgi:hypothetical protein
MRFSKAVPEGAALRVAVLAEQLKGKWKSG